MTSELRLSLSDQLFNRPRSYVNLSSFLLWGLGVATAVWASARSADDLRRRRKVGVEGDAANAGVNHMAAMREEAPVRDTINVSKFGKKVGKKRKKMNKKWPPKFRKRYITRAARLEPSTRCFGPMLVHLSKESFLGYGDKYLEETKLFQSIQGPPESRKVLFKTKFEKLDFDILQRSLGQRTYPGIPDILVRYR